MITTENGNDWNILEEFFQFKINFNLMTIRILVNGAQGKMGQLTVKTIGEQPDFSLVGATDRIDDLGLEIKKRKAQVVIDFTNADSILKNVETILDAGVHPVIGTTGLIKDQIMSLQERAAKQKLGGVIAPNFSLAAVLMMKHAADMAKYFPEVEVIEMHHTGKLDSPSGTALRTAELLAESRGKTSATQHALREIVTGARGADYNQIHIHSVRLPGLVANQEIIFGGLGETLTIRHSTIDRQCFMPGVILACKKVMGLDRLVYGLEHFL